MLAKRYVGFGARPRGWPTPASIDGTAGAECVHRWAGGAQPDHQPQEHQDALGADVRSVRWGNSTQFE